MPFMVRQIDHVGEKGHSSKISVRAVPWSSFLQGVAVV